MKILYIHQYFRTPEEGGCTRSYHLAKKMIELGHEVAVFTSHTKPHSDSKMIEGIQVRYFPIAYANEFGFKKRIIAYLKFAWLCIKHSSKVKNIDLAYVMTTPLTTGLVGLWLKKFRKINFYFEVGDLWPEAPIQIGAIRNSIVKRLLYAFEKRCYHNAEKVIALSPAIQDYITKIIPKAKTSVITNISHCEFYQPTITPEKFNAENPFVISYIGTLGQANDISQLFLLVDYCEQINAPILFHIMGEGIDYEKTKVFVSKHQNATFHEYGNKQKVKALLDQSQAVYVSFAQIDVLNTGSPNKFFDGLAAGKLIIINFEGWIKELITAKQCGFYHSPYDPDRFWEQLKPYVDNREVLISAQRNTRDLAESHFDLKVVSKELEALLAKR